MSPATVEETKPTVRLFSRTRMYRIPVPHPDFENGKPCLVRFPTDEEWCRRFRQESTVYRDIGRNLQINETKGELQASKELFDNIRQDEDGPDFDEHEAKYVIDFLLRRNILSTEREGGQYRIAIKVIGASVEHVLKIPTQRQIAEFDKGVSTVIGRRTQEFKVRLETSGELWDKLKLSVSGYEDPNDVPIIHKNAAVAEVVTTVRNAMQEDPDPEE